MASTLTITDRESNAVVVANVQVDSLRQDAILADDNRTPIGQRIEITGTGTISGASLDYLNLNQSLRYANNRQGVAVVTVDADGLKLLTVNTDDNGGPYVDISTTEIVGSDPYVAFVKFTVRGQISETNNDGSWQTVTSHRWTQKMSLDGSGRLTRQVNGSLTIAESSSGSSTTVAENASWYGRAPIADLFRRAITPTLTEGWRRESSDFALDEKSTTLIYSFIDKQNLHDLPDGVLVGDMDFSYERNLENPGFAMLQFSCELEGGLSLKGITGTTGNRRLVEAAVALSKTRIDITFKQTMVTRLKVTEKQMLTGFGIRFEMDAMVTAKAAADNNAIVPLAYLIGNNFTITRSVSRSADSYGDPVDSSGYGMVAHVINNEINGLLPVAADTGMPRATMFTVTNVPTFGTVNVAVVSSSNGVSDMNTLFDGKFQDYQTQPVDDGDGFSTNVTSSVSYTHAEYDSGLVRLSPMYLDTGDFVFQTRKPRVFVTERTETARMNQAPPKFLRPLPIDAYLINDDWKVAFGKFDAQGNRMFTGIYERTYAMYDIGAGSTVGFGYETQGTKTIRVWNAPNQTVAATVSAVGSLDMQGSNNVFAAAPSGFASTLYSVPTQDYLT